MEGGRWKWFLSVSFQWEDQQALGSDYLTREMRPFHLSHCLYVPCGHQLLVWVLSLQYP